ncbi:glycosyltransferase involved in cell wall biosynthesis [Neorhizobium galegae]|uniref:glycosyltransferase family 4 protein n=1 Tax=Neorhizobium galegae TaxID=399 RepID=UPI001AE8DC80|nr:glycosyltransferase family 4 protein [Neorhizobium galegae]MBP2547691.1 glycosyltransferase involved in cell wall biosynthesis [Neorhizobium galegae]
MSSSAPVPVAFLASADYAPLTGGYVYNARLIEALTGQHGAPVPITLDTGFPTVPLHERASLAEHLSALPQNTVILTDHLYLVDLQEVFQAIQNPVVAIFHHSLVEEQGGPAQTDPALREREAQAVSRASRILVTSPQTAHYLQQHYGVAEHRIRVAVPGNRPAVRGTAGKDRSHGMAGPRHLLSVGAVIARKRYDYCLDVAAYLPKTGWRWTIVGDPARDPALLRDLQEKALALGLHDRLVFSGDLSHEALETVWQETDLYIAASRFEGYGMAIAEAFRHGVPVITTASGAVATWASGGIIEAPDDDAKAMAGKITALLENPARLQDQADRAWVFGTTLPTWEETFDGIGDWVAGDG